MAAVEEFKRQMDDHPMLDGEASKRQAVGEFQEDQHKVGGDPVILKILLPEKETGHVIGKGGSVLTKIKTDSNARVRISAIDEVIPGTRERICTIAGTLASVLLAQKLISNALVENSKQPMDSPQRVLKLLLSHMAVGCVIGRGGTLIKEMMMQTGAIIKASQPAELIQATNERWLSITGTPEAIEAVVGAVMAQIMQSPAAQHLKECDYACLKQVVSPYQGMPWPPQPRGAHQQQGMLNYGGYSMGAVAARQPNPQLQNPNAPMAYKQFMSLLDDNVSPEVSQAKYQDYLRAFGAAAGQAAVPGAASPAATESMTLPDKMVSGIIGKGGAIIKELMARSGAQIQISQKSEATTGGERVVTMTGSNDAVATAQHFIKERLKEIEAQRAAGPAPAGHASPQQMAPPQNNYNRAQGYAPQSYVPQGYTHSPTQPAAFLQHGMPPHSMPLTMPQPSMNTMNTLQNTMFSGQPGQFQQWQ